MGTGIFTISLDVELYWGLRDEVPLDVIRSRLLGDRDAFPRMLDLFVANDVRATWAAVGFLFFDGRDELLASLPEERPRYRNEKLDPYRAIASTGKSEAEDPFHFAPSLLRRVVAAPGQELATHTFSHYYCLEAGQTEAAFRADIRAAKRAAERVGGAKIESLVFPRNQCAPSYLATLADEGLIAYRGTPTNWMYRANAGSDASVKRAARLLDSYVNVAGLQQYTPPSHAERTPVNVPASRFLRPWSRRFAALRPLQHRRVLREMTAAAKTGALYHLWWHPHNFGLDQRENLATLRAILDHYRRLHDAHGMRSLAMKDVARAWSGAATTQ